MIIMMTMTIIIIMMNDNNNKWITEKNNIKALAKKFGRILGECGKNWTNRKFEVLFYSANRPIK